MDGSNTKDNLSCAACLNDIGDDDYVTASGNDWHKDCFRCSVCDAALSTWYFEKAGLLFCQADYWARYGETCQQCSQVITGPVMSAGAHRFHPECFACGACGAHVEDGEPYALVDRSKLFCGSCYARSEASRAHAIRVLHAPARALRVRPAGDALRVTHVDSSCGLLALQIGDRILEINGAPVNARGLPDHDAALDRPDAVVQLTVEHNPSDASATREADEKPKHDVKSPVERKILREDVKKYLPDSERAEAGEEVEVGRKERVFKRKGTGGGARLTKRRPDPAPHDKERSSSMSKLLDDAEGAAGAWGVLRALSRARSFSAQRAPPPRHAVFRAADLLQGELLGSGFFGQVYKVTHRDTAEVMVLKQLYRVDERAQRNFLKEVAVLRSLAHPNVLRFVGVLYRDKRLHLVTEYVPGGTLHQLIQDTSTPLSWGLRARLARGAAAGVRYLHAQGVIHRDLNSHNCLVREDKTVIVADFGLARIVRRPLAHHARTRKRYTVVGNPYWMAPEMMNGDEYDERVDVFSFGIILCEIIGRVSADPDYLPRRADFGLNEAAFVDKFCAGCPEPLYRLAFLACRLDPDARPSFEQMESWLGRLVEGEPDASLVRELLDAASTTDTQCDIAKSRSTASITITTTPPDEEDVPSPPGGQSGGDPGGGGDSLTSWSGVIDPDSRSEVNDLNSSCGRALGKCVSAGHITGVTSRSRAAVTSRSRSHRELRAPPHAYILRTDGGNINITRVSDISQWLDPPPLKRCSPDAQLATHAHSAHYAHAHYAHDAPDALPAFLRNQSVEELETEYKSQMHHPTTICRHESIPDHCHISDTSSSSSDDEPEPPRAVPDAPRSLLTNLVRRGENLLAKKSSYDVTLRNPECLKGERKIPEEDYRRYNIDHLTKSPIMAEGIKNIPKTVEAQKQPEKTNFFTKKLLSPKLSRLFKPNTAEAVRNKPEAIRKPEPEENKEEKSRSKFFIQRPASPYRVRPLHERPPTKKDSDVIKSDLKLASLGKPMTPIFRRHIPTERPEFADGRFSYRDRRYKPNEGKFVDVGRNRIKTPVVDDKLTPLRSPPNSNVSLGTVAEKLRSSPNSAQLGNVTEKKGEVKKREGGISRSNYVSLANLRINGKPEGEAARPAGAPERVI